MAAITTIIAADMIENASAISESNSKGRMSNTPRTKKAKAPSEEAEDNTSAVNGTERTQSTAKNTSRKRKEASSSAEESTSGISQPPAKKVARKRQASSSPDEGNDNTSQPSATKAQTKNTTKTTGAINGAENTPTATKKTSKKRKANSSPDGADSVISQSSSTKTQSTDVENCTTAIDGAQSTPTAAKKTSKKRKVEASPDENGDSISPPVKEKTAPKKRQVASSTTTTTTRKRGNAKSKQPIAEAEEPEPTSEPAPVNQAVANKIDQVLKFINQSGHYPLDRDSDNRHLVSVPELDLLGALQTMRIHYQIGQQHDASITDVEEAIVERFKQPVRQFADADWVTLDLSIPHGPFLTEIHGKVENHGLDNVHLLATELEMRRGREVKIVRSLNGEDPDADLKWDVNRFVRTFEEMYERAREEVRSRNGSAEVNGGVWPQVLPEVEVLDN